MDYNSHPEHKHNFLYIMAFFTVHHTSKKTGSSARLGTIETAHGSIQTPAFVSVGTKGTLKGISPLQAHAFGVQASFVNTYHLVVHPGPQAIADAGSIHAWSGMKWPLMSDSGGFQIFSLAGRARRGTLRDGEETILQTLTEDLVVFRSTYNGDSIEFSPEKSMEYQQSIGADLCMAFDECTYYPSTHQYAQESMERTHRWLMRCIAYTQTHHRADYSQYLYGIIQGGAFQDLREASAQYVVAQDTPGIAIGGVSVGESKELLREQVAWVAPYLPENRPVHLLGVGHLDDIMDLVHHGIDTFDCVEATRLARMGVLLQIEHLSESATRWQFGEMDMQNTSFHSNNEYLFDPYITERDSHEFGFVTKSFLHHLFKQKELLGYTIATIYNLTVMEHFMRRIREEIQNNAI